LNLILCSVLAWMLSASRTSAGDNALSLGGFDLATYRGEVGDALTRAVGGRTSLAYEEFAQRRACELLTALKKNDDAAFAHLLKRDQGYP
jgi:hypothetical protein